MIGRWVWWVLGLSLHLNTHSILTQKNAWPEKEPHLRHSPTKAQIWSEGKNALLTCVVKYQGNYTVMWKKNEVGTKSDELGYRLLTANKERVTSDKRVSVIHENGGSAYVLSIVNTTAKDSGMYLCEVNSNPPARSFHNLKIKSNTLLPTSKNFISTEYQTTFKRISSTVSPVITTSSSKNSLDVWGFSTERPINHDFSDCCSSRNVSQSCMGFCDIKNILEGNTGINPSECEEDFTKIVSCMADGRNHVPCCLDAGVPPVCTDICRGEYTKQTDNIKTVFSCAAHTAPTLACISAGIDTLPPQPEGLSVTSITDTSLLVSWLPRKPDDRLTQEYAVNMTFLKSLMPEPSMKGNTPKAVVQPYSVIHMLDKDRSEIVMTGLEEFAIHEVSMWAENSAGGSSLPTYSVRVVTHMEGDQADKKTAIPILPNVRSCCIANNVSHASCVTKFCDPRSLDKITIPDMIVCAPWDTEIFQCLADGRDHSPCCAAKQIPPQCQELCSGNVTDIDFKYFRCLKYMSEMSSCMLEGYGVLPSSPVSFRFSNVDIDVAILHWERPEKLGNTVIDYVVNYRKITPTIGKLQSIKHAQNPFILANLDKSSAYEVYVEARNDHGIGEDSTRIVFRTASRNIEDLLYSEHPYNQTNCCVNSGVKSECLSLCSFNASITEVRKLSKLCADEFSKVVRCGAGGRDHLPCCTRRGVPLNCQPLCQAVHQTSTGADFISCLPSIGQVVTCWEEGTLQLPPPVIDMRAVSILNSTVILSWKVEEDNDSSAVASQFEVYYKMVGNTSTDHSVFDNDKQVNTTSTTVKITDLIGGKKYKFFIVSRNDKGTSLPSSVLTINITNNNDMQEIVTVKGGTSPPHQLAVDGHSATYLQLNWNPPAVSHPEDIIRYRLYYKKISSNQTTFSTVETDVTTLKLRRLSPNTQYFIFATAILIKNGTKIESSPSETLFSWTDPAFPAYVEAPTIHPINMVTEGSTMTVLCIAMGTPLPTVTLYLNGHPLRSEVTRHMVTMIHNVTRDMGQVACYADNGYGTPMQVTRSITISRKPTVTILNGMPTNLNNNGAPTFKTVKAVIGDIAYVKCKVDAFPAPTVAIFRDRGLKQSVQSEGRYTITASGDEEDSALFYITLKIDNVAEDDAREFYCHANNTLGDNSFGVMLDITDVPKPVIDMRSCCSSQNVSTACLSICSFSLDLDVLALQPNCLPELGLMMNCASDGSDHRHCCSEAGVPKTCLGWCRGEQVKVDTEQEVCAIEQSSSILGCFHQGQTNLPSPPQNVRVRPVDKNSAKVFWDIPKKNPNSVELYRVFLRPTATKNTRKFDTVQRHLLLEGLTSGITYELAVKAGNSKGTSQLTTTLKFVTGDEFIIATSPQVQSNAGGAVGIVMAVLVVVAMVIFVVYIMKRNNMLVLSAKKPVSPSVSFENPFYGVRDQTSTSPIPEEYNVHISSSRSWQNEMSQVPDSGCSSNPSSSGQSSPDTPQKKSSNLSSSATEEANPTEKSIGSSFFNKINLNRDNGFKQFQ